MSAARVRQTSFTPEGGVVTEDWVPVVPKPAKTKSTGRATRKQLPSKNGVYEVSGTHAGGYDFHVPMVAPAQDRTEYVGTFKTVREGEAKVAEILASRPQHCKPGDIVWLTPESERLARTTGLNAR